jgi:hypothetical protein
MVDRPTSFSPARHDLEKRQITLEGFEVAITSYRIGERYSCTVDNIDPGGVIGRGSGGDRKTAEDAAIEQASMKLCLGKAGQSLSRSMETLRAAQRNLGSRGGR